MNPKWPMVPLGEVLTERQEFPLSEDLASGRMRIVGKISFDTGQIQLRTDGETRTGMIIIRPGDLVISGINAHKGAIAVYGSENSEPIAATIHYGAYIPNHNQVKIYFLWWLLRSKLFRDLLAEYLPGGIKTELKAKRLLSIPIPLPSLEEQQGLVSLIEGLAAQINEARGLRVEAINEVKNLVFSACEDVLLSIEGHFPNEPLYKLVDQERGISYGIVQTGANVEDGIPTLRAGDMSWFSASTADVKRVSPEIEKYYQRTRLRGGELLLRIRGGVGEFAVCPATLFGANVSREIAVIPLQEYIDPRYAMYVLAAPSNQIRLFGHVKGTSYVGINLKDVRNLPLPIMPLSEQQKTVMKLDELRTLAMALQSMQEDTFGILDTMLPAILVRAFKGDL